MSFAPVIPMGGYGGWTFLKRTQPSQQLAFAASAEIKRDEAHFRATIGSVKTAEDLVSDRRLLKVALGAFGLDADINNKFFIRKVLEDGTLNDGALSNRLSDKQYRAFSQAFGFGDLAVPNTQISTFADTTIRAYETQQFEQAVGAQSGSLRLALNAERQVGAIAGKDSSDDVKWYTMMGSAPLRRVFQTAFGLPSAFAAVDIDQQLGVFKAKADQLFGEGEFSQFSDPEKLNGLLRRFLALADQDVGLSPRTKGAGALQLLQSASGGGGGVAGILALLA